MCSRHDQHRRAAAAGRQHDERMVEYTAARLCRRHRKPHISGRGRGRVLPDTRIVSWHCRAGFRLRAVCRSEDRGRSPRRCREPRSVRRNRCAARGIHPSRAAERHDTRHELSRQPRCFLVDRGFRVQGDLRGPQCRLWRGGKTQLCRIDRGRALVHGRGDSCSCSFSWPRLSRCRSPSTTFRCRD